MKTASFFTFTGAGRISIARWAPRDVPAGFRTFRPLAPGPWFKSVDRDEYQRRYVAQLAPLDPAQVWDELHRLAAPAEPVLLGAPGRSRRRQGILPSPDGRPMV